MVLSALEKSKLRKGVWEDWGRNCSFRYIKLSKKGDI